MRRYQGWVFALAVLTFVACAGERQNVGMEKSFQEQKEDFIAACENKLNELGRGIDQASEAAEYTNSKTLTAHNAQIVELVREKSAVGRKLEYLHAAYRKIWPYMKTDIEEALDDLTSLFEGLLTRLFEELQASIN